MVAALVRLLHSGTQDQRLLPKDGPKDVKAYVRVLTRAGRMTTQWSRLDFQQLPTFGQQAFCTLQRKGTLITRLYLVTTMPDIATAQIAAKASAGADFVGPNFCWTNSLGHALIASASVDIGGQRVETIESRLLEMLDEFNTPLEKVLNVNEMIKRVQNGFPRECYGPEDVGGTQVVVPLPFWFSRGDLGAALPIDALNVDEVRVGITFNTLNSVYYTESRAPAASIVPTTPGSALWPLAGSKFYKNTPAPNGVFIPGLYPQPASGYATEISGVRMPTNLELGETYLLAEYVYLDKPEANRFRLANIEIPVTQHVRIEPYDTRGAREARILLELNNPTRNLFFMAQNYDAIPYNAPFLATRALTGPGWDYPAPWWPDCSGLRVGMPGELVPGFVERGSEPLNFIEVLYEGEYVKTSTENCSLYRTIIPGYEGRKCPWHWRYFYMIPFGVQPGYYPPSVPMGQANLNRIMKKELRFGINGYGDRPTRVWIYCYAETYNVLRMYGGRATMLFSY